MLMDISKLSCKWSVKRLTEENTVEVYKLCTGNPQYYEYHPPFVTMEMVREDFAALPPGKDLSDKYYLGFYDGEKLIAVLDLIDGYPTDDTAFIGFFMMNQNEQGEGTGSAIISAVLTYLKEVGFRAVRLAWIKGNPQAEHFWKKNGFEVLKETEDTEGYVVVLAEHKMNLVNQA